MIIPNFTLKYYFYLRNVEFVSSLYGTVTTAVRRVSSKDCTGIMTCNVLRNKKWDVDGMFYDIGLFN